MPAPRSIAIIGAGMAGLACAAALRDGGAEVTVFDKGRRPGGRIATRRVDGLSFDHGAQYATARSAGFDAVLAKLQIGAAAAPWPAAGGAGETRWIGTPGMSALPRALGARLTAAGASLQTNRHVGHLHHAGTGWTVRHFDSAGVKPGTVVAEGGDVAGGFDAVLLAIPAPQAAPLLTAIGHGFAKRVSAATFAPCWAVMAAFAVRIDAPDATRPHEGPLGWIARENSRPGRADGPDAWTLHATAAWSRANLERAPADIAAELLHVFAPDAPAPIHLAAHRWRYALVETPLRESCLWDRASGIGVCGDFCLGPRVEAAWLSGTALASAVLSHN